MEKKPFTAFNHGTNQIDVKHLGKIKMMLPTEIHYKEDGSITNGPSFAIVLTSPVDIPVVGQISLKMLNDGLNELGYEIVKK